MRDTVYVTESVNSGTINVSFIKELAIFVLDKIDEKIQTDFENEVERLAQLNKEHNENTFFFKRTTNIDKIKNDIDVKVYKRLLQKRIEDSALPFFDVSNDIILEKKSVSKDELDTLLSYVVYYGYNLSKSELLDKLYRPITQKITNH